MTSGADRTVPVLRDDHRHQPVEAIVQRRNRIGRIKLRQQEVKLTLA